MNTQMREREEREKRKRGGERTDREQREITPHNSDCILLVSSKSQMPSILP